jgi:hypothetical protein
MQSLQIETLIEIGLLLVKYRDEPMIPRSRKRLTIIVS